MVNFLLDKYPSETGSIVKRFEKETPMSLVMATSEEEEEELRESEEEESVRSESKDSNPRPKKRRESICAEKLKDDECDSDLQEVTEKSESEMARISEILMGNMFFSHLDDQQMKAIRNTMFLITHADGDIIIRQGDEGENFFLVDSGVVEIFINDGDERNLVKTCQAGDSFGELALLYGAPRAASCLASGDVRLWALDRISFKRILMKTTLDVRTVNKSFLQNVPLFSNLDEYELLTISDSLHEEIFEDSQTVLTEGEEGDKFFLIKDGCAVCTKRQSDGSSKEVKRMTGGEYFGELALLKDKPRQATVTAEGSLSCLSMNRATFNRLVCMKELLVRNMETYSKN
mmetsp:Transcript_27456/g.44645  ORF Transcript_27456/g.44645 Transcript_27456/m.44645 type:complete len:346 (+) Transcript_27456:274-1311(+)